jgi:hypothetical protein
MVALIEGGVPDDEFRLAHRIGNALGTIRVRI